MAANNDKARKIKAIEKRILPVSEAQPYVKALIYGKNGSEKTRLASSGPKTLIVDLNEKGTKSVRQYKNTYVFPAKVWQDYVYAYWFLKEGNHDYETVTIDTLTQAQHMCMTHVLKKAEDRDPNRPPSMPIQRDWNQMSELMKEQIYNYRNLDMHVVFICQERANKQVDEDDPDSKGVVPDLSPAVRGVAMAAVEIMGRTYKRPVRIGKGKKEKTRWEPRLLVGPHDNYETKDRSGVLPLIVRNPNMQMLIDASAYIPEDKEDE